MTTGERASVCTLDCPDTCSLTVTVADGRVAKVRGSRAMPYTDGVICNKVAHHSAAFMHGPGRLLHPLRRVGARGSGEFQRIGWAEALDDIHRRVGAVIERWGAAAVAPLNYAGPHGLLSCDSMSLRFFHKLGASRLYRGALCGGVRSEAWAGTYGAVPGIGPEAAGEAELNLVWGNNATVTNLHLVRQARAAKRRGGRLAVIDPLRSKIATHADLHLAPMPGTDVVLGFALAVELERLGAHDRRFIAEHVAGYEEFMVLARAWPADTAAATCGVAAEDIRTLARWMADADPLVLAPGNGLERGRNGGSGIRAAIALPALLGKLGKGSGIVLGARNAFPKTLERLTGADLAPPGTRTLNILDIGRHLLRDDIDPPLRALFIYNHNPIVVHPDQNRIRAGLRREDVFCVGIEIAMTESMRHCDIVLPAATHFECDDLYLSYGHHWLQRAEPVVPPLGEALPNTEIFRRLAARFGFTDACFRADDRQLMDEAIDGAHPRLRGMQPSAIPTGAALRMATEDGRPLALFETVMPATPSGKVELASDTLARRWGPSARLPSFRPPGGKFPLALISPASDARISSTLLGAAGALSQAPPLLMHPADAEARGLVSGTRVRVRNDLGAVVLPLRVTDAVAPGVVASEKGAWLASSETGQTISALVSADLRADLADGACFNDTRVEVEAA
ncbi:MAG TPA: molybdopterin-dependent oxidoreductase [Stellaceae bacterium]|nr:molybdopterin-dependent oxidoreductase [Stellaceae bacterium]